VHDGTDPTTDETGKHEGAKASDDKRAVDRPDARWNDGLLLCVAKCGSTCEHGQITHHLGAAGIAGPLVRAGELFAKLADQRARTTDGHAMRTACEAAGHDSSCGRSDKLSVRKKNRSQQARRARRNARKPAFSCDLYALLRAAESRAFA
jgi:hypothetical protein